MKKTKIIRFVESLVLLPLATMSGPGSLMQAGHPINTSIASPQVVLSQKLNTETDDAALAKNAADQKLKEQSLKAAAVDAYFKVHGMPLAGTGMKMVQEAEKNDLDWRLIAAIAVRESTGGIHGCKKVANNPFGWASCKVGFKSNDAAIETIARNLGGNNPKTAFHYDDKTTIQILHAYNPPSIIPRYAEQVMNIMNAMGNEDVTSTALAVNS